MKINRELHDRLFRGFAALDTLSADPAFMTKVKQSFCEPPGPLPSFYFLSRGRQYVSYFGPPREILSCMREFNTVPDSGVLTEAGANFIYVFNRTAFDYSDYWPAQVRKILEKQISSRQLLNFLCSYDSKTEVGRVAFGISFLALDVQTATRVKNWDWVESFFQVSLCFTPNPAEEVT